MLSERNSRNLIIAGVILAIIGAILFLWNFIYIPSQNVDTEKIAQFGDYFSGIIGSIWSLAGVILFYVALQEQRRDIEINRIALEKQIQEFELQREELSETREVFKEQSETLKVQRFENTFFQLLNLHHEIINNLDLDLSFYNRGQYKSREVFKTSVSVINQLFSRYDKDYEYGKMGERILVKEYDLNNLEEVKNLINRSYNTYYFIETNQLLSHYFRSLYHIFKFIHKSELINDNKKQFYATLLRAQLSSDELFLLLYNSLNPDLGYPNFLFLIKRFDILQNFDFDLISEFKNHHNVFDLEIKNVEISDI